MPRSHSLVRRRKIGKELYDIRQTQPERADEQ